MNIKLQNIDSSDSPYKKRGFIMKRAGLLIKIILGLVFIGVLSWSVSFRMSGRIAEADSIITWLFSIYSSIFILYNYIWLIHNQ
jgi:hypothetical protein